MTSLEEERKRLEGILDTFSKDSSSEESRTIRERFFADNDQLIITPDEIETLTLNSNETAFYILLHLKKLDNWRPIIFDGNTLDILYNGNLGGNPSLDHPWIQENLTGLMLVQEKMRRNFFTDDDGKAIVFKAYHQQGRKLGMSDEILNTHHSYGGAAAILKMWHGEDAKATRAHVDQIRTFEYLNILTEVFIRYFDFRDEDEIAHVHHSPSAAFKILYEMHNRDFDALKAYMTDFKDHHYLNSDNIYPERVLMTHFKDSFSYDSKCLHLFNQEMKRVRETAPFDEQSFSDVFSLGLDYLQFLHIGGRIDDLNIDGTSFCKLLRDSLQTGVDGLKDRDVAQTYEKRLSELDQALAVPAGR